MMRTDPVSLEIMRNYYLSIANGMAAVIERTSYTSFIKETADFGAALIAPTGEFFIYPRNVGVTIFVGLNLLRAVEECGTLEPGDIIIFNDPYTSNGFASHLPDIQVFKPVFYKGKIVNYSWAFVHCSDIGGLAPGSISPLANDIHQEGLRMPPVKLFKRGEPNKEVETLIYANCRIPTLNHGDVNAMVAAVNTGEKRMLEMIEKYGIDAVDASMLDLLDQGELRARQVISKLPDGDYKFADYLDDDMASDVPIRLALTLKVKGDEFIIDFSECDPQVCTAFNVPSCGTKHSYLYQGLINYIFSEDPYIPINGGIARPISVISPKGCITNPEYPAAVGTRHPVSARLYSAVLGALSQIVPDRVPAAGAGQAAMIVLSTPEDAPRVGRKITVVQPMNGGSGALGDKDGADGQDHVAGFLKNTPIEILEQEVDTIVDRYELIPDTAGPGEHRGGYAIRLDFEIVKNNSIVTARGLERMRFEPWGLVGGKAGSLCEVKLNPDTKGEEALPKISVLNPVRGDVISIRTPGGGGWGDPFLRPTELVLNEVRGELLSPEKAKEAYGVIVKKQDGFYVVDEEATKKYREENKTTEIEQWNFGKARREYESRWTAEASAKLAVKLQELPPFERSLRKHQMHKVLDKRCGSGPVTVEAIEKAWGEF
ncbi:MAG: hydantoinase B/oxoprolinase family protein [Synergistes jonesii]|uniref:hydantoinase B/oxoprolinase family protein n=1 Tax=Synergistes jonesii TaxID=2754 RepID=UPI002A752377|nr:hydantoinase B/oxoprolinase family protein [Synergistes jonesii]MDY2985140.1 hydantoinase B/oxoprolinase family protein [Synergistes jonesii]